jgi:hypothetical protein
MKQDVITPDVREYGCGRLLTVTRLIINHSLRETNLWISLKQMTECRDNVTK